MKRGRYFLLGLLGAAIMGAFSFTSVKRDKHRLEEKIIKLEKEVARLKHENMRLERGIHLIWIEDDEALPLDGGLVKIMSTAEDSVFVGLPDYSSFKSEDEYRHLMYELSNRPFKQ
jgi:hypothetical protein